MGNKPYKNRELNKLQAIVERILALRDETAALSDAALRRKTWEFRRRHAEGESLDDLLPEAYAVVREAARRVLGMEHFPVQLLGGVVLHQGRIAEMCTGEGKTLVATLPAYLNAIPCEGVHVVTVNDYLAKRDMEQMGRVHEFLGLSVGAVLGGMDTAQRKAAYACDITYVTNHELGFDYLRDNMATHRSQIVQRGLYYVIIDEVDSVLIDDARTPLIISGEGSRSTKLYEACSVLAKRMVRGEAPKTLSKLDLISGVEQEERGDYIIIEKEKRALLTAKGIRRTERFFRVRNLADTENLELQHHMDLALRAHALMVRDRDYVVQDGEVLIVDGNTGRIMPGRRYSDGLHQAIEAKERVRIQKESRTIATITYQSFFNKYKKRSGMTGTGKTEANEFVETYGMDVVTIPTNRPIARIDREDIVFRTLAEKYAAVCDDVVYCRETKRPVLVGTASVSASEELSGMFTQRGIRHHVLNAKNHAEEAAIVADAGHCGAVTIATNMAGRGTDIKLDDAAKAAGGLLVIGTERHDSRRIDGQLRGRAGRQGDPGESRFYLSLEDDLLRLFGQKRMHAAFDALGVEEGAGVTSPALSKAVEQAQRRVESDHFAQRRRVLDYDQVMDRQREIIYDQRRRILLGHDIHSVIVKLIGDVVNDTIDAVSGAGNAEARRQAAVEALETMLTPQGKAACLACGEKELAACLTRELKFLYDYIEEAFSNSEALQERERQILLQAVDQRWMEHLDDLVLLRDGIGLVTYAQMDPLVAYRKAAFQLFDDMNRSIRRDAVTAILETGKKGGA